jgi:hypothetical protein
VDREQKSPGTRNFVDNFKTGRKGRGTLSELSPISTGEEHAVAEERDAVARKQEAFSGRSR